MPYETGWAEETAALTKKLEKLGKTAADIPQVLRNGVTLANFHTFSDAVIARNVGVASPVLVPPTMGVSQDVTGINSSVFRWQQQLKSENPTDVNAAAVARLEGLALQRPLSLIEQSALERARSAPQTYVNPKRAAGQMPAHIEQDAKRWARMSAKLEALTKNGHDIMSMHLDAELKRIGKRLETAGVDLSKLKAA